MTTWSRDYRFWLVTGSLLVIALLDLAFPVVGFRTFLVVPVVASVVLGRPRWTLAFSLMALLLYVAVSLSDAESAVLYWRRLAVLGVTFALSVFLARTVRRDRTQLEQKAEDFQLLAENSTDVVFRGTRDGCLEWISPQVTDHLGWAPAEMIGRPFTEFVHPDDALRLANGGQSEPNDAGLVHDRMRIRTSDGAYRWNAVVSHPMLDNEGNVVARIGGWTDIHDVVAAREEADVQRDQVHAMRDSQLDPFIHFTSVLDDDGRIVDLRFSEANEAAFAYNLSTPELMLGHTFLEFFPGLMEHGPMALYLRCAQTGEPVILDDYAYPNEILGDERRYDIRAAPTNDGMMLTWRDVTERHRAVEALADSERRYRLLAENGSDVIWQVGASGLVEWASESSLPVLGWAPDELVGELAIDYIDPEDLPAALAARTRVVSGSPLNEEFRMRRADGTSMWMEFSVSGFLTPEGMGRIVSLRDIDAEVTARRALAQAVGRDPLTGLQTRDALHDRVAGLLDAPGTDPIDVLCIGVDQLSAVNDAYTHAAGDVVLVTMAGRIVAEVGEPENVYRGAGVDFLVLLSHDGDLVDATALAERIRDAARQEIPIGPHRVLSSVSIGIAAGDDVHDAEQLVRAASLATRTAKVAGRDRIAYSTPELAETAEKKLTLASEIARAFTAAEFTMWFQPINDVVNGQVRGYEALARWIKPDGSVIEPVAFMSVIEATPLIMQLDEVALAGGIAALESLPGQLFVSVNVSARSLSSDTYVDQLVSSLRDSGVEPARLHLEITETALLDVSRAVVGRMQRIADAGGHWYVDDFGTGFSSISHLRDLPVRGLKLDLSFTRGVGQGDLRSIRLAQALAGLAQGLGLDSVAEGVETKEQAAILGAQGWRHGQGWLYGKAAPLPVVT